MGCGGSKPKMIRADKGFFPEKVVSAKNTNVHVQEKVYLFGGARILEFDTKTLKLTALPADNALRIPRHTQCEYIYELKKIVTLGGLLDGKATNVGYMFTPPDFHNYQKLPNYPMPIKNTTLTYFDGTVYAIGGETDGPEQENIVTDCYKLSVRGGAIGAQWEKFATLLMPRRSPLVAVTQGNIFVFGGYNGKGLRTTQIETIDVKTGEVKVHSYRLPLGVEGARLCWQGDDVLVVGGRRIGDKPDSNVILLDLEKKTIMSRRDLNQPRDFPIIIPTALDEVVVIGGGGQRTAEKRAWNPDIQDYEFKPIVIEGQNLIDDPANYDTALPSFVNEHPDNEVLPDLDPHNIIIFGNEIDCFLIEIPSNLKAIFYPSPMRLQQKTGQTSIRSDYNTIYFVGGTDTTRTKISQKTYKMFVKTKEIVELGKLKEGRYYPQLVHMGSDFYVIGGKGKGGLALASMEKQSQSTETQPWQECPPMRQPRFGHVAWVSNNKIFVIGGTTVDDGKPLSHCEVFDTTTNTWSEHSFRMNPPLNGASKYITDKYVYLFGGQDTNDIPTNAVFRIDRNNPVTMERLPQSMKVPRVDCFVFRLDNRIIVVGGSEQPVLEAFDDNLQPVKNIEDFSESFFNQLKNYTTDLKLENCSFG